LVRDLAPGLENGGLAGSLTALGGSGLVVFAGHSGLSGLQLWVSDGTAGGTRALTAFVGRPGVGAARLDRVAFAADKIFFRADDSQLGEELWRIALGEDGLPFAEPFGTGCAGTGGRMPVSVAATLPRIGTTFVVDVQQAMANSVAVLHLGFSAIAAPIGNCTLYLAPPVLPLATVPTDAAGRGTLGLPLGLQQSLVGAAFVLQRPPAWPTPPSPPPKTSSPRRSRPSTPAVSPRSPSSSPGIPPVGGRTRPARRGHTNPVRESDDGGSAVTLDRSQFEPDCGSTPSDRRISAIDKVVPARGRTCLWTGRICQTPSRSPGRQGRSATSPNWRSRSVARSTRSTSMPRLSAIRARL
jgi:ELWxxDGT repeat protein